MTPHPWEGGDNPYEIGGGASYMLQRQVYPKRSEHADVDALPYARWLSHLAYVQHRDL